MITPAKETRPLRLRGRHEAITLAQLRHVLAGLPDDVPLQVGIRDDRHFNRLIGDVPVVGVSANLAPNSVVILLDVPVATDLETRDPREAWMQHKLDTAEWRPEDPERVVDSEALREALPEETECPICDHWLP